MLNLYRVGPLRTWTVVAIFAVALMSFDRPALAITSDEYLERAQGYFEKREWDASIIELKNALQRNRKNAEARLLLGRVYIEKGSGADAEKELRRALDLGLDAEDVRELMGRAWLMQDKFDKVLEGLAIEGSDTPTRKASLVTLRGEAYLGLGNTKKARESFTTAVGHSSDTAEAHVGLARIAIQERSTEIAEAELAKALAADPKASSVISLKGDMSFARGAFPEAERAYEELVNVQPFIPNLLRLGFARSSLGKHDEAIADVEQVLRVAPRHPGANYLRALAAYRTRDYQTAKFHIDQSLTALPLNPQFQLLAGATSYAVGQNEQALRYLERYLAREPGNQQARQMLGATQLRLGDAKGAQETLKPFEGGPIDDARLLALIGTASVRSGDLESGRRYLEQLVEAQPENSSVRATLGAVELALGNAGEGISDLEKALEQDPSLDRALISLVIAFIRENQYDRALETAQRLLDKSPESSQAHTLVGVSHAALGNLEAATEAFARALEIRPGARDAATNLAAIKVSQGKLDEASDLYDQVLERSPDDLQTLLGLAGLERKRNRPGEELGLLERAVDLHPDSRPAMLTLARAYVDRRSPQKALAKIGRLLDENPDDAAILQVVGEAQLQSGDPEKALDTFRRLVEAQPDHAISHFHLARAFEAANAFDEADIELQKALLLNPAHTQAKFARARLLVRQDDLPLAKSILEDLKSVFPDEPAILDLEARIALRQDRPADAVEFLKKALEVRDDGNFVILLSQAQARAAGVDQGIASLDQWLVRFPEDLRVRTFLAQSYLSLERFDKAEKEYETILENAPDNIAALNNLAWVNWRLGNSRQGVTHARRALLLAPDNPGIMDTLGILLLEQGESAEALTLLRQAYDQVPRSTEIKFHLARALAEEGATGEAKKLLTDLVGLDREFADRAEAEALLKRLR